MKPAGSGYEQGLAGNDRQRSSRHHSPAESVRNAGKGRGRGCPRPEGAPTAAAPQFCSCEQKSSHFCRGCTQRLATGRPQTTPGLRGSAAGGAVDFARPRKCWHCLGVPGGEAGSFAPEFAALPRGHSIAKGPQQLLGEILGEQGDGSSRSHSQEDALYCC